MENQNAAASGSSGSFVKAFVPGLVLGLIVGLAGAFLPGLLGTASLPEPRRTTTGAVDTAPRAPDERVQPAPDAPSAETPQQPAPEPVPAPAPAPSEPPATPPGSPK